MDTPTPPQQTTPPVDAGKKPMPAIAKVGIGCGILTIIGVIVMVVLIGWCNRTVGTYIKDFADNPERAAAEFVINVNPELELVESSDEAGTITFRDKASGKETTMSWSDIAEGRMSITDSEGTEITFGAANMDAVPAWVPRLPETTQLASSYHSVEGGKMTGAYMAGTTMSTADIETFLAAQAQAMEMESVLDSRHASGDQEMRMIGYKGGSRGFSATIIREGAGDAQVQFLYEEESGN